jgi:hypothetical protein
LQNQAKTGGAESGAVNADLDSFPPDLAKLVELWGSLSDNVKGHILTLAEFAFNSRDT